MRVRIAFSEAHCMVHASPWRSRRRCVIDCRAAHCQAHAMRPVHSGLPLFESRLAPGTRGHGAAPAHRSAPCCRRGGHQLNWACCKTKAVCQKDAVVNNGASVLVHGHLNCHLININAVSDKCSAGVAGLTTKGV